MFCLIPKLAESFKEKILNGTIDPLKMAEMTSEERRSFLSEHLGGEVNAREANALFESKLLLKNQQLGMINWAKQMLGEKHPAYQDVISKIQRMDERILNPDTQSAFLEDLASKKLGTDVTFEEAKTITEMTAKMREAEAKINPESPIGSSERLEYGAYKRALQNYIDELKLSNKESGVKTTLKENINPLTLAQNIGGFAKGVWSSMDVSAFLRQGLKPLIDSPAIWAKNVFKSFDDIMKQVADGPEANRVMDAIMADIYSRPNAMDGTYRKMKLDIGEMEEAYPTTLPERLPLFGRLYKASEVAYTGFLRRVRADMADKMIDIAKDNDFNFADKAQVEGLGQFVNSMTGRGHLGKFESAGKAINNLFFSAKKIKSDFDFLTGYQFVDAPRFAKVRAAQNLLKTSSGFAAITLMANALQPGTVNVNPRSSNFMKIKIGDTVHDITAGMSGMIVLLSRMMIGSMESASGKQTELNTGKFGEVTSSDLFWNWLENKMSPILSLTKDVLNRKDFNGNPTTLKGEAEKFITPLPISDIRNIMQSKNSNEAKLLSALFALTGVNPTVLKPPKAKENKNGFKGFEDTTKKNKGFKTF